MARQKRSPNFKGHHFSSLAAHKELELFLRKNLSNNFGCGFQEKVTAVKLFGETMVLSTPSLGKSFCPNHSIRVLSKYSN
jgi:hypothetical protein